MQTLKRPVPVTVGIGAVSPADVVSVARHGAHVSIDEEALSDTAKLSAKKLQSAAKRMTGMIDDLFDLARFRLGDGIALQPAEVSIAAVAEAIVGESQLSVPDRKIELRADGDTTGVWDAQRLGQIIANLVNNALRHGDPSVPVQVKCTDEGSRVRVSVHNGGTIDRKMHASLFDPFRQRTDPSARQKGLGLGLFIVDQLVKAHGGVIEVDSSQGSGTCFAVTLPRALRR